MKFSTLILSASVAISSVFAIPHHRHQELHNEKRQSGYTAVTGPSGPVYPRLEIRQMYWNRPNQYTLLLLALQKFQSMSESDKLSYYQIAGIHGVPRVDWDGVGECSGCSSDGYCPHDSVLFPAWHRVYVALFEQQFLSIVNDIANSWTGDGADVIRSAASQMRWPYWDWAAAPKPGYNNFPALMSMKYVSVTSDSGTQTIINPLFRYSFQDNSGLVYYPFVSNWKYTYRYPNTNDASAVSQTSSLVSAFNNIRSSLQDQVWQLFSTCTDYLHFSNDDAGSSSTSCSNSLEGIHNTVHTTTGGVPSSSVSAGHMTYLSTAAFDPVFWLHHANVDRIFALWQTINPGSYGGSQTAPHSTWTIPSGSQQDENSPLTPMHKDTSGNFYTTNDVRDWTVFKYTYPEFSNSDGSASAIKGYVSALYGPGATATAGSSKREVDEEEAPAQAKRTPEPVNLENVVASVAGFASPSSSSISGSLPLPTVNPLSNLTAAIQNVSTAVSDLVNPIQANNGSLFQYVANIQTPRYALNGSYQIYLFNGKPNTEDPASWIQDSNLIGPVGVLAQPGMTEHNVTVAASVPLTRSLTFALDNSF
ncbi:hypothetical protein AMS68_003670 [Peltaster fructicola]|uniref:tyrosinase n=1 Tax=Peltaster fructicola TaxID=286661 RepID=A0A6H0XTV7_9PEZI|nr:hypothetical protein AMS68_003670 [Peltaster fructicola]